MTPNQYIQLEMGVLVASHNIRSVTDLDDRNQVAFSGAFGEIPYGQKTKTIGKAGIYPVPV
jgi:ABC-type lipopolysaccharide export system ATPase subunit